MKNSYKILVIEDEKDLLSAISMKLKKMGHHPISRDSAESALEYLKSAEQMPDAIWLDYYLKDMNGLGFMNEIKENEKLSNIPIIVVSNSASVEKENSLLALGAKKYMLKADYKLEEIINTIREVINGNNGENFDS